MRRICEKLKKLVGGYNSGAAAEFLRLAAACAAQARRLRGCGMQGMKALHRIGRRWTRKVSAIAARLIVQVWSCQKLGQHVDADNSRKLDAKGKAQIGRRLFASAQDGKAERTVVSGRFGAAALSFATCGGTPVR